MRKKDTVEFYVSKENWADFVNSAYQYSWDFSAKEKTARDAYAAETKFYVKMLCDEYKTYMKKVLFKEKGITNG